MHAKLEHEESPLGLGEGHVSGVLDETNEALATVERRGERGVVADALLDPSLEQSEEEVGLGVELGVDDTGREPGRRGDLVHGGVVVAARQEDLAGGGEDALAVALGPLGAREALRLLAGYCHNVIIVITLLGGCQARARVAPGSSRLTRQAG